MSGSGRPWAYLLLTVLLAPTASSATPPSCGFSSSADQGQLDGHAHHSNHHDHGLEHHFSDHDHAHHHAPALDPDHDHSHGRGCEHDHEGTHFHTHQAHDHHHHHHEHSPAVSTRTPAHKLPEELAEEEELRTYGFKSDVHEDEKHHDEHASPSIGLWMRALGCSLLVSMASLICLVLLPLIVAQGKPSRVVVDFLAAFGAGAMLGDAFLHQLPHALGGSSGHSHSHGAGHEHAHAHVHLHANHNNGHSHDHYDGFGHSHSESHGHAHSIQDLSVGLAVLAGIILFFIVEKIVRQVEKASAKGVLPWAHHHHHHHGHPSQHEHGGDTQHRMDDGEKALKGEKQKSEDDIRTEEDTLVTSTNGSIEQEKHRADKPYRRKVVEGVQEESESTPLLPEGDVSEKKSNVASVEQIAPPPNLVLGYLNLFSDGVHNFTDGMALGAAFLNHGTLGGWSRTLFLLAHELPQEVGDFGILVQSGFGVLKALAFNFLSALAALAGTAVALLLGGNPGHSSLIEGFTAGGFIYIAVAGVLPEMHQHGTSTKTTCLQLLALGLGMSVALWISLVE